MRAEYRLDVLIRTSQRKAEAKSPQQQIDICRACAAVNGYRIVAIHDSGGSESGKTMARDTVSAALARLHAGETDGVMVAFLDRLGRAPIEEAMAVVREIHGAGGVLVPADAGGTPVKPDDPQAETNLVIQLQIARQYWLTTANRFNRNRENAIRDGKSIGGAPFGYRFKDPSSNGRGGVEDSHLVVVEDLVPIVRELFQRKADGATWLELARWLDKVAPKPGARSWARTSVAALIACRTFLGEVHHGEHVHACAHEPIVPPDLWRRAQAKPGRRTARGTYLLSGLARCAGCGRNLRGSSFNQGKSAIYTCAGADCPQRCTIMAARLDHEVTERALARFDYHLRAVEDSDLVSAGAEVERLSSALEVHAMVTPSHATAVAAHQRTLEATETALNEAEDRLAELTAAHAQTGPDALDLRGDWPTLDLSERREILAQAVDAVVVRRATGRGPASRIPERVLVLFRGEAPEGLIGRPRPVASWAWDDGPGSLRLAG